MTKAQKKEELEQHLFEQIEMLKSSCKSFDDGMLYEAKRIATSIRVLLHNTKNSHALIDQLGIKNKLSYLSTAHPYNEQNLLTHLGLVRMTISNESGEYLPHLDDYTHSSSKKFDSWWNEIIIKDNKQNKFTRKDIILTVANKDGGAHIDPKLEEDYHNLTRENGAGWMFVKNGKEEHIPYIELNTIRQIAYELIHSFDSYK